MSNDPIATIADCTAFRQTLLSRPPRLVHATVLLLAGLLGVALAWSAWTVADLVVRAPGRVRAVSTPQKVINTVRGDGAGAGAGGRVVEVHFREGDRVRRGDVLVRLDTERLDNDIRRRERIIRSGEDELARLRRLDELLARQAEATRARAQAELDQALAEVRQARERRDVETRLADAELVGAEDELARTRRLAAAGAATAADGVKVVAKAKEARGKRDRSRLPVDESKVPVLRQALVVADRDAAVKREELAVKQSAKQGEVAAARLEMANLELERQQCVLRSPLDGVVTAGDVKVGDVLDPGKVAVEIAEENGFRFEMAVASEDVAHLRVGMPARIKLDAYDYQNYGTLSGKVSFIAPDSTGGEGPQAARYLLRIDLDADELVRGELRGRVKLGMAGQAEVVTERRSLLWLLFRKIRHSISLG
jgi:hemolysin D